MARSKYPRRKDHVPDRAALVVTQMPSGTVDWMAVGSAAIVAGVASLGTSLAGLPELEKGDNA